MEFLKDLTDIVTLLPRGGYIVQTAIGYIQFGSPPETIKDTMSLPLGVPQIYVLPKEFFNWSKGISVAEFEFPIYYNYFIKKRKTYLICYESEAKRFKQAFQESVFGPLHIDLHQDYDTAAGNMHVPDITKEMAYFRNNMQFSDLLAFGLFENDSFTIQGITIKRDSAGDFQVCEGERVIANVKGKVEYKPTYDIGERLPEPYKPPLFGVTCLGMSNGFDPYENTSGFIIWLNHSGIMVDPPVNSTEWLEDSNVNPKLIDSIILTHNHADHDAGTFQKILEEGKITIYATKTIMMSFLRKYASLTDLPVEYLMSLFEYQPVKIGKPVFIHGGRFEMFYTLHSIPAIGFKLNFQGKSFVYSSDHNADPALHKKLLDEKVITPERYQELRNFPWDSDVIYHEANIPPLHTPIQYMNTLPEELQKRIVIYHLAKKFFPPKNETHLTLAQFGIENTLYFNVATPTFDNAYQVLSILRHLDFFTDLPISKAQEFLSIVEEECFDKGDTIIREGTKGDKFYIIYSGNVSVKSEGIDTKKVYGSYDYFGEVALITEQQRTADVIAETDVIAYTIERDKFLSFIADTEFENTLRRLVTVRSAESWNILSNSPSFVFLTSYQKTWLESILVPIEYTDAGTLIYEGEELNELYIIRSGKVQVSKNETIIAVLKEGDVVGIIQNLHTGKPAAFTFSFTEPLKLYALRQDDVARFIAANPGVLMKMRYDFVNDADVSLS